MVHTLGTALRHTIFAAAASTLKNIAAVSGDSVFTCFRAPSSACNHYILSVSNIVSIFMYKYLVVRLTLHEYQIK
jgi:hypothetical protein